MVALFVIFTILLFLTADFFVQRAVQRRAAARGLATARVESFGRPVKAPPIHSIPGGVFLDPTHTWARILPSGELHVGADGMVAAVLGAPDALELLAPGTRVEKGATLATLHRGDRRIALRSPVEGVIEDINLDVADHPVRLADDPFEESWLYRIRPVRLGQALRQMVIDDEASRFMSREADRLRDAVVRLSMPDSAVGQTLLDGGAPIEAMGSLLDEEAWQRLSAMFFAAPRFTSEVRS